MITLMNNEIIDLSKFTHLILNLTGDKQVIAIDTLTPKTKANFFANLIINNQKTLILANEHKSEYVVIAVDKIIMIETV